MTFHCTICQLSFTRKFNLDRHNLTKSHLEKLAKENLQKDISILEIVQRLENQVEFLTTQLNKLQKNNNTIDYNLEYITDEDTTDEAMTAYISAEREHFYKKYEHPKYLEEYNRVGIDKIPFHEVNYDLWHDEIDIDCLEVIFQEMIDYKNIFQASTIYNHNKHLIVILDGEYKKITFEKINDFVNDYIDYTLMKHIKHCVETNKYKGEKLLHKGMKQLLKTLRDRDRNDTDNCFLLKVRSCALNNI